MGVQMWFVASLSTPACARLDPLLARFDSAPGGNEKGTRARPCASVVCVMQEAEGSSWSDCDRTAGLFCSVIGGDKEVVTLPLWLVRSGESTSLLTITLH